MPNKWKVSHNYVNGADFYQVYRLLDVNGVDHSGNREYLPGVYEAQPKAQMMANRANRRAAERRDNNV